MPDCPAPIQLQHTTELADLRARVEAIEGRIPAFQENDRSLAVLATIVARLEKTLEKINGTMNRVDENLISLNSRTSSLETSQKSTEETLKKLQASLQDADGKSKVDIIEILKKIFLDAVPKIIAVLVVLGGIAFGILKAAKVIP